MYRKWIVGLAVFVLSMGVAADSWIPSPERIELRYSFGATELVLLRWLEEGRMSADYELRITTDDQLKAIYRGVAFDHIFSDKDNSTFVGLRNSGIPGTALIIFDKEGNLIRHLKHNEFSPDYCDRSVSIFKEWVDEEDPDVKFSYRTISDRDFVDDITFINCHGERVSIFDAIDDGMERYLEEGRALQERIDRMERRKQEREDEVTYLRENNGDTHHSNAPTIGVW